PTSATISAVETSDTAALVGSAFPIQGSIAAVETVDVAALAGTCTNPSIIAVETVDTAALVGYGTPFIKATETVDRCSGAATANWASASLTLSGYSIFGSGVNGIATLGAHLVYSGYTLTAST